MLEVVIATDNSERVLVPTLAALVPGAAAGLLREVIVADARSSDATAMIADAAGCRFEATEAPLGARLRAAAAGARAPWLLFLRPGVVPDTAWIEEVRRFIQHAELGGGVDARAAAFRPGGESYGLGATIGEGARLIAAALGARPQPQQGLLISKTLYDKLGGHRSDRSDPETDLLRRLGRGAVVMLRSRIVVLAQ